MKIKLTIVGLLLAGAVFAAPIECHPTKAECIPNWDKNLDCYVQPQSFCDALMVKYQSQETAKYEAINGKMPSASYFTATDTPILGAQVNPPKKALPIVAGFTILASLIAALFITNHE